MRRALVFVALVFVACKAAPPPIQYGGAKTQLQDKLLLNSFQLAYEHCSGDKGPLALPVHKNDYNAKRWSAETMRPEHCYFKPGGLLQGFEMAARLSAPNAPSFDAPSANETMWSFALTADDQAVQNALVSLFGQGIVRGSEKTASGEIVRLYDGAAMQAIFRRLYVRPTEMRAGYVLQQVYDLLYRDSLRAIAKQLVMLQANPDLLAQAQQEFEQKAPADPHFDFFTVGQALQATLSQRDPQHAYELQGSFLGTVVRRTHDGTLPVLRDLLRQVLQDYDPSFARTVQL